jgi:hypothetical protein
MIYLLCGFAELKKPSAWAKGLGYMVGIGSALGCSTFKTLAFCTDQDLALVIWWTWGVNGKIRPFRFKVCGVYPVLLVWHKLSLLPPWSW